VEVFVAYVGDPDFHDGHVFRVSVESGKVEVIVEGYSGRQYVVSFDGVEAVSMNSPVGMELYSLSEMQATPPLRKFVSNSDDDDPSTLSVTARDFSLLISGPEAFQVP